MNKNYFIPTLILLALFSVVISYFVSVVNREVYLYGLSAKQNIDVFSHRIQFSNYECSFPTDISDDPIMRSIRGTLFGIDPTYVPDNLIAVPAQYKNTINTIQVRSEMIEPLTMMIAAGRQAGFLLGINSGYRDFERQRRIFENPLNNSDGQEFDRAARPGFSEHQLGTAVDLSAPQYANQAQIQATYNWLYNNAHLFGFVLSYPRGAEEITGFQYEPWHHRYVGPELASVIHTNQSLFNETQEAFMDHPFFENESTRHSFTGEEIFVQLRMREDTKDIINEGFIDSVLSVAEIDQLLRESKDKGSVILPRDDGPLIFSVILNEIEVQGRTYTRYQLQGNGAQGERIFLDEVGLPQFDAKLLFAYSGRLDQSDILQKHVLENCR